MGTLKVTLLQLTSHESDQEANLAKGDECCRRASETGADIALFPELWNVGYTFERMARQDAPDHHHEQPSTDDLWRAPQLWKDGDDSYRAAERAAIEQWHTQAIGRDSKFVTHF